MNIQNTATFLFMVSGGDDLANVLIDGDCDGDDDGNDNDDDK